jgi:hypothetical protein
VIVVIQCAAKKNPSAGYLQRASGKKVLFVADPENSPTSLAHDYARPDDLVGEATNSQLTWRQHLLDYNAKPGENPLQLMPAWQLYGNQTYRALQARFGLDKLYILSAGWGLLAADFLTPVYDITFSASAERYKRRRKKDLYTDLCMLPAETDEPIVFLGGKDYVNLFCELTQEAKSPRHIFYNSASPPDASGCELKRFQTTTRTNWHYECAKALIENKVSI